MATLTTTMPSSRRLPTQLLHHLSTYLVTLLLLLLSPLPSHSELLGTILVSRHGTRAPNAIASQLCPSDSANFQRYESLDISVEGVTGRGMHQLLQLGEYTREQYVDTGFLKRYYSNEEMYIRAVGEDRTLQSAVAWGHGLYPAGHGPVGYPSDLPSPLPVYTLPDELDLLLENRKAGCHQRLKADVEQYDNTTGMQMRQQHAALLQQLEVLCGVNLSVAINGTGDNYGDAVKDITDEWTFDFIEHFPPLPGLSLSTLLQFRAYAVQQLIGRILGTPEQVTYMNGDLPLSMLRSFTALIHHHAHPSSPSSSPSSPAPLRFLAYHGHREMMYALAAFFDIRYNITYPALPLGAIPPATSLFFELHHTGGETAEREEAKGKGKGKGKRKAREEADDSDDYVIKAVLWSPCDADDLDDADRLVAVETVDMTNLTHTVNTTHLNHTHDSLTHYNHTHSYPPLHNATHHNASHHNNTSSSSSTHHSIDAFPPPPRSPASTSSKQCGGRPIAISGCPPTGVCTYSQFRHLIRAQINSTGHWRALCAYDEHTGREAYDDSGRSSDRKIPGSGEMEGDHSKAHQRTHPLDEEGEEGGEGLSTGGAEEGEGSSASWWGGWGMVVLALIAAAVIGALGYWYFFMRGEGSGEYERVPNRV